MMLELNEENFEKTINASTPTVVDFWASWCGPCRMMAPAFEQVGKELAGYCLCKSDYGNPMFDCIQEWRRNGSDCWFFSCIDAEAED